MRVDVFDILVDPDLNATTFTRRRPTTTLSKEGQKVSTYATATLTGIVQPAATADANLLPEGVRERMDFDMPIEIRPVNPTDALKPEPCEPCKYLWFRADGTLPDNPALHSYAQWCYEQRERNLPTLPGSIGRERDVNPFLRAHEPALRRAALAHDPQTPSTAMGVFTTLRAWKNEFK